MNAKIIALILCLVMVAVALIGCTDVRPVPRERRPDYSWGFSNRTSSKITDVRLVYPAFGAEHVEASAGTLGSRSGSAGWGPGYDPIPDEGNVHWTEGDVAHVQTVRVANEVQDLRLFSGTIHVIYLGGDRGWVVVPQTYEEKANRAVAGLPLAPDVPASHPSSR
jgi:hypothetical protein